MGQQGSWQQMMLPLAMFAAIFYFMIMRPQKKKQKQHSDMLASISKGSEVITAGGFFGIVREVLDDSYIIEMDENVKVRILKSSISIKRSEGEKENVVKKEKKKRKKVRRSEDEQINGETGTESAATAAETEPEAVAVESEAAASETETAQPEENNEEKA